MCVLRVDSVTSLLTRCLLRSRTQAKQEVFPSIGTAVSRPRLEAPRDLLVPKSKIPFGPGHEGVVVKHHAKFPQPFDRLSNELEAIFKLASTSQAAEVRCQSITLL